MNKTEYEAGLIILNVIKSNNMGKHKLAQFLKGSKSKDVSNMANLQGYGGLMWHRISTIEKFIEQMIGKGFLQIKIVRDYAYSYPIIELTENGKKALENNADIELNIIKEVKPLKLGDSERTTLEMLKAEKNAVEIASARSLAISTVYTHFYRLIVFGQISCFDIVSRDAIEKIKEVYNKFAYSPTLKELKEALPPSISYGEIRCVIAEIRGEEKQDLNKGQ